MTTFTILSAKETDVVVLGQTRDEVRAVLGAYRTFRRTPDSEEADQFTDCGAIATYSSDGDLVMLELADPAEVELGGVQLLGKSLDDLESELSEDDVELRREDEGASIPSVSVSLFAPGDTVEGVQLGSD